MTVSLTFILGEFPLEEDESMEETGEEEEAIEGMSMDELSARAPREIFTALGITPPSNLTKADLDHAFSRKNFSELSGDRRRSAIKVTKALLDGISRLVNADADNLLSAAVSAPILSRTKTMLAAADSLAAAVRRGEPPPEIHRQLSVFCAGDFTREEFVDLFADSLGAGGRA